ncbi:hypothetical protein CEXT_624771 [Caerostris extrusa]|uniref:Ycf15 n=1 Tax=Caerostris extrusa TaxID=172846 RepID=A0AAV4Y248_CAEEX|nr:hypothetical protein CEXT_624771 [Caerostris extrusa]
MFWVKEMNWRGVGRGSPEQTATVAAFPCPSYERRSDLISQIISFPELMTSMPKTPFGTTQLITSQLGSWQDSLKSGS